jgi:sec-independent protein translocase protein TatC
MEDGSPETPSVRGTSSTGQPLVEHLRELRSRLLKASAAIVLGMVAGWVFYDPIFAWLSEPFRRVVATALSEGRTVTLALTGVADPFVLQLQVAAVTGLLLSSPIWLYQLWRFVTPGLHRNERRWALGFVGVAVPLFAGGVALAYAVLPYGLDLLIGFTPANVENIISVDRYLSFFIRTVLVFGVGFLVPLFIVVLNFAGVLSGQRLIKSWRWILVAIVVFAAVATPTGDPINLLLLAGPMGLLVSAAVGLALLNDRRRRMRGKAVDYDQWADDEVSPLADDPIQPHIDGT